MCSRLMLSLSKSRSAPVLATRLRKLDEQNLDAIILAEAGLVRLGLADRITAGTYPPGQRIMEQALAAEFGVSRGPVRDALRLLEKDGLVTILPRRGAQVTKLTIQEVREIFDIRVALNGLRDRGSLGAQEDVGEVLLAADERVRVDDVLQQVINVRAVCADATKYTPISAPDAITFSYSLTMIPDWFLALDQALRMLKPGGMLGVVDFFVARKWPADGLTKHAWSTRTFWPTWFANDNVFLNGDHIPYLQSRFETLTLQQHRGKVPYLPFVRAPYYLFIGKKPLA